MAQLLTAPDSFSLAEPGQSQRWLVGSTASSNQLKQTVCPLSVVIYDRPLRKLCVEMRSAGFLEGRKKSLLLLLSMPLCLLDIGSRAVLLLVSLQAASHGDYLKPQLFWRA